MKNKTISEYILIDIDEPHKKQIVENVILQGRQNLIISENVPSRSQALLKAFIWGKSEQGFEHWHELFLYFVQVDGANQDDWNFFNERMAAHAKHKKGQGAA